MSLSYLIHKKIGVQMAKPTPIVNDTKLKIAAKVSDQVSHISYYTLTAAEIIASR